MEEQEILKKVVDLTVGRKIKDIVVPVKLRWWERLLGFKPYRVFELFEPVCGNVFRIAGVAVGLPDEVRGSSLVEIALPFINAHHDDIVYIIASGITNSKEEPPQWLIDILTWNLKYEDLYETLQLILDNSGLKAFMNSMILAKGEEDVLITKISPIDRAE